VASTRNLGVAVGARAASADADRLAAAESPPSNSAASTRSMPSGRQDAQDNNTPVFHVRDGKVTEVWQYWSDQYAADELFA
jgi:hypothetical protein